ncbi:hypothetical protein CXB51_007825 [Gossypium anomalum]|uniref:Myb-like domain-containing protein n=1 Tax=Gossypium anomalum TaxID=47600 RepID=A0A8J5ZSJ2_9ROSI|nr:hypothetical protein CXB51_007825 [Gossypium anomalum]
MQQGGGGGGHQSQYGEIGGGPTTDATSSSHMVSEQSEQLEEASPISYRPPAAAIGNPDELMMRLAEEGDEGDRLGGDHGGGVGGGAGGVASGNRWPRQETLALLKIRSDMDGIFRDATVKGPLWEDVSRKLAELGYKRSAKKCKEKFENVHKYYKRTKDGRGGRQDGKSYKFFSELEALNTTSATLSKPPITPATSASLDVAPISVGIPMPISSVRIPPTTTTTTTAIPMSSSMLPMPGSAPPPPPATPFGISFSSNSSSSSQGFEDEDEIGREPSTDMGGTSRKRKRQSSSREGGSSSSRKRMMEFFEGLMKQVMQKQEALQQTFLESIEKREQDRMIREEAWKRQEMARLAREHELIAQERAIASSRDAAIISFLQKITGQTIQLPTTVSTIPSVPPPPTQPATPVVQPPTPIPTAAPPLHHPPSLPQQKSHLHHQQQQQAQNTQLVVKHNQQQEPIPSEVIMAIPEQKVPPQEIGGSEGIEPASSRWPKAEVLALINLRSGLETRYQEAGPKGPLWEEISAGMSRMGYKRSAKRCKEKWENINKYFKRSKKVIRNAPRMPKPAHIFINSMAFTVRKYLEVVPVASVTRIGLKEKHHNSIKILLWKHHSLVMINLKIKLEPLLMYRQAKKIHLGVSLEKETVELQRRRYCEGADGGARDANAIATTCSGWLMAMIYKVD